MHPFPLRSGCATDHQRQHMYSTYIHLTDRWFANRAKTENQKVGTLDGMMGCDVRFVIRWPYLPVHGAT